MHLNRTVAYICSIYPVCGRGAGLLVCADPSNQLPNCGLQVIRCGVAPCPVMQELKKCKDKTSRVWCLFCDDTVDL